MSLAKFILRLFFILAVPLVIAGGTYAFLDRAFFKALNPADTKTILVEIPVGLTFHDICNSLKEKGILRYPWSMSLIARFKKADTRINAGEYELSPSMTPQQVLNKLVSGDVFKRRFTFKEGQTIWELGSLVEAAGLLKAKDFTPVLTDSGLLNKYGLAAPSFEGYLFPDTYQFSRPITPASIIWKMLDEGERHWDPEYSKRLDELRMTRPEIMTLASIIEKESGNFDEQPLIASVFHNRLAKGMKLQADPTVIYGIPNFNGNLTRLDLQNAENPYNTYIHFGLPPGPICNPGASAIKAALYPAETNYYFFVADGNGRHVFASTLQEHNQNVDMYQRGHGAPQQQAQK